MEGSKLNLIVVFVVLLFPGAACTLSGKQSNDKSVIRITARMFAYSPSRIELKKGEPVTLELTSLDRMHGFNMPGLGVRADVLPGQSVRVDILPEKAGRYTFLCDIFCGDGHDEMNGVIVVKD
jgi:cytochrome c oxidase subunit 2